MNIRYICALILLLYNSAFSQDKTIDELIKEIPNNKIDSFYYEMARSTYKDDPHLAIDYARNSYEQSVILQNNEFQIKSQFLIGAFSNIIKNWSDAKKSLDLSIKLAEKYNLKGRLALSYFELGILYMNTYQYDLAIENYFEAIKYSEEFENHRYKIAAYNQIGLVYLRLEKYEEALSNFLTSLDLRNKFGIESGMVLNKLNIALCYHGLSQYKLAIENYYEILSSCYDCRSQDLITAHLDLSASYIQIEEYQLAKDNIQKALLIEGIKEDKLIDAYSYLSKIYLSKKMMDSAIYFLDKSIFLAEQNNSYIDLHINKRAYAEIYKNKGDYKKALELTNEANQIKDSIYSEDLSEKIRDVYVNYEKYQSGEIIQGKDTVIKRNNQFLTMLGIIIFLMIVILSFTYRTLNFRKKLNEKLDEKVQDKTKELRQSNDQLIESKKELDSFLYRTSHDIRGPIATLIGLANLAQLESKDAIITSYLEKINITADRLNIIISRLTNISQINSQPLDIKDVDFYSTINEIIEELSLEKNGVSFKLSGELPTFLKTDKILLKIILSNVLDNAFKFHDSIEKNQYINLDVQQNGRLELTVTDNGVGIENQYTDKIFDLFFVASERDRGAGIGLYQSMLATNKMHGNIELLSNKKPTKFKITLPVNESE